MNKTLHIILQVLSVLLAVSSGLMALDHQIAAIGLFSPKVAMYWPVVMAGALVLNRIVTIIIAALSKVPPVLIVLILLCFSMTGCLTTIGSIGFGASYRDEKPDGSAQEFGGNINVGLKDAKQVKKPKIGGWFGGGHRK